MDPEDDEDVPDGTVGRLPRIMKNRGGECGKISVLQVLMQTPELWPRDHNPACGASLTPGAVSAKKCVKCCLHWLSRSESPAKEKPLRQVCVDAFCQALSATAADDCVSGWLTPIGHTAVTDVNELWLQYLTATSQHDATTTVQLQCTCGTVHPSSTIAQRVGPIGMESSMSISDQLKAHDVTLDCDACRKTTTHTRLQTVQATSFVCFHAPKPAAAGSRGPRTRTPNQAAATDPPLELQIQVGDADNVADFQLCGVVLANGAHYTAAVCDSLQRWWHCDDGSVVLRAVTEPPASGYWRALRVYRRAAPSAAAEASA